jgi:hypothetical protein
MSADVSAVGDTSIVLLMEAACTSETSVRYEEVEVLTRTFYNLQTSRNYAGFVTLMCHYHQLCKIRFFLNQDQFSVAVCIGHAVLPSLNICCLAIKQCAAQSVDSWQVFDLRYMHTRKELKSTLPAVQSYLENTQAKHGSEAKIAFLSTTIL